MSETKNSDNIKIFISYRNMEPSSHCARILDDRLSADGFETFFDTDELQAGDLWAEKIYLNISHSDVLIVLLQSETIDSDWVQREVDMARGAKICILPVVIDNLEVDLTQVIAKLEIRGTQFVKFDPKTADIKKISDAITDLSQVTRDEQKKWVRALQDRRRDPPAQNRLSVAAYEVSGKAYPCEIHLASGDMSKFEHVDVLVNSVNDYMQMAQFYETKTLSSSLRIAGANRLRGGRIIDHVQQELNDQLSDIGLPVQMREVIVTHAGHPDSRLVKRNGIRYIFHVATSQVNIKTFKEQLNTIDNEEGVAELIQNCLEQVRVVNEACGVISMEGTTKDEEEVKKIDNYKPIKSIMFPIIGTGRGGRSLGTVLPQMIKALDDFLSGNINDEALQLDHVYICVYPGTGVQLAKGILDTHFSQ